MILINIEMLSDSELKYIAKQENLQGWEDLDRDELIEALQEFYEEDDSSETRDRLSSEKYTKTLTSTHSDNVIQFPGVRQLPETYNETSIHQVLRDSNWAYVFWNTSKQLKDELEENPDWSLFLRNEAIKSNGEKHIFDVEITKDDINWNIELPWKDCTYKIKLMVSKDKEAFKLCETKEFHVSSSYYLNNCKEVKNETDWLLNFDSLFSKDGRILNNNDVNEIIKCTGEVIR